MFDLIEKFLSDFGKNPAVICSHEILPDDNKSITFGLLKLILPFSI